MKKMKELYKFTLGSTVWCFTSGDSKENYDGKTYLPVAIDRSEIESKNEMSKETLDITIDKKNEFARKCLLENIYNEVKLELFIKENDIFKTAWTGRVSIVKPGQGVIVLVFESNMTDLRRVGGRRKAQRNCDHALYGSRCKANKENFFVTGTIKSFSKSSLVISECATKEDYYFSGGEVLFSDGFSVFVEKHIGDKIYLIRDTASAKIGETVKVYAGCDKGLLTCNNKFNNINNFGGLPYMPTKNPFVGDSIY
jgi:uncharacterized phage protein (TIGR02218 family)